MEQDGHDVARISRTVGTDLITGDGRGAALADVEAVVDATNATPGSRDEVAAITPLLIRPTAPAGIADVLAEIAAGPAQGRHVDVAGPVTQDLVDVARRTNDVLGRPVRLVPTWSGRSDTSMAGDVLLPGDNARVTPTTFDQWLADGATP